MFAGRPGSCMLCWGNPTNNSVDMLPNMSSGEASYPAYSMFFLVRSNMLSFRSQCSPTPIPMASGDGVCLGIEGIRRDVFVNMP